MFWKHIEQGYPSDFCTMSIVAGTTPGNFAYLFLSLQKQTNIQKKKHNNGKRATKIKHKYNCICTKNSETKNSDMTTISDVFISGTVASTTIP